MMMINSEKFVYNDTPEFPFVLPKDKEDCLHKKTDVIDLMGYIFYEARFLDVYPIDEDGNEDDKTFKDKIKYIGVYENSILQEVIYIDYDNIINTMNDLKKHMDD